MKYPRCFFKLGRFKCQCPNKAIKPQINKCIEAYFKLSRYFSNEKKMLSILGFREIFTCRFNSLQIFTLEMV